MKDPDVDRWMAVLAYGQAFANYSVAFDRYGPARTETVDAYRYLLQAKTHYVKVAKRKVRK